MRAWFDRLSVFGKGLSGAICGVLLVLLLFHLYVDHLALHEMANFVNSAAPKIQKLP